MKNVVKWLGIILISLALIETVYGWYSDPYVTQQTARFILVTGLLIAGTICLGTYAIADAIEFVKGRSSNPMYPTKEELKGMWTCPYCGERNTNDKKNCSSCGKAKL